MVAENVLESPSERNFRDKKNDNLWGMPELDLIDKIEHNFEPDVKISNCHNCNKL